MAAESAFLDRGNPSDPAWAWAPYEPSAERPWDLPRAGHLFRRAAFGARWETLQRALAEGPQRTIEKLLRPPENVAAFNEKHDGYEASASDSDSTEGLRSWWLRRMAETPHPLLEKMTLFWHGHFAAANSRVKSALNMGRHLRLLRRHGLGNFGKLLEEAVRDPALLLALDGGSNRKGRPSETFPRKLFGLITLGPGNFSETDVREAARALTGWFVLRGEVRFIPGEHDGGTKRILGREGQFGDQDLVRILLEERATPRLVVQKLHRFFISETDEPPEALISPLAESFGKDYEIAPLVERILRSNLFFSGAAYRRKVKSPVEYALGILAAFEGSAGTAPLGRDLAALGQDLCDPPTSGGWAGGSHWINRYTLLGRSNLALGLLGGDGPYGGKLDPLAVATEHGKGEIEPATRFFADVLVDGNLGEEARKLIALSAAAPQAASGGDRSRRLREIAHLIATLPEFQLA